MTIAPFSVALTPVDLYAPASDGEDAAWGEGEPVYVTTLHARIVPVTAPRDVTLPDGRVEALYTVHLYDATLTGIGAGWIEQAPILDRPIMPGWEIRQSDRIMGDRRLEVLEVWDRGTLAGHWRRCLVREMR